MEIKEIIKNLTLEEKALLVGGADAWNTVAVKRLITLKLFLILVFMINGFNDFYNMLI